MADIKGRNYVVSDTPEANRKVVFEVYNYCGSEGWGPLDVEACLYLNPPRVIITASVLGHEIGTAELTPGNDSVTISGNVEFAKAEVTFRADFSSRSVRATGEACVRTISGGWACDDFDAVILDV